jgi:hypothetical protein
MNDDEAHHRRDCQSTGTRQRTHREREIERDNNCFYDKSEILQTLH